MDQPTKTHAVAEWAKQTLHLLPDPALWWPAEETLFIADLHLGKAASYRALGQPVPSGSTQDNLSRLTDLIARHQAKHIVLLGDFLHAASGRTSHLLHAVTAWRAHHAQVAMTLVRGNHDDRAGDPPAEACIEVVDQPWLLGPFACCHHPQAHPTHFVLAGHDHPVVHVSGPGRDRLRLPCFVNDGQQATLPAFGAFTGGHVVTPRAGQSLHAVGGGRVWTLPT
ncbi:ligase-associated DNA damage response endonuclease PdeM [Hydrogenophaga sp.]|uniref:ligase-associated DNA damage response endonuclease PdeM n=1 Tax=Hydrogenophaga sp. TaxID=1904254 RepID=UPI0025BEDC95|nr:ligase-associated DNA damage response endonuclease PdeM [Hydrogenophaga sp.]